MAQHTVPANELAIKALQCPQGKARVVYHVDGHGNDGLKIYVESSGTKTWYYRARVAGSDSKDMALGRWPDLSIIEARKRKSAIVVSISDGEDPWRKRAAERRRKPGITLNDAFAEWLETAADQKRSRHQDKLRYDMNIRGGHQFILGKWKGRTHKTGIGHLPVAEITRLEQVWGGEFGDEYVDRNLGAYDAREPFWSRMTERLRPTRVLEVGCNAGGNLRFVAAGAPDASVYGIDINRKALRVAAEYVPYE